MSIPHSLRRHNESQALYYSIDNLGGKSMWCFHRLQREYCLREAPKRKLRQSCWTKLKNSEMKVAVPVKIEIVLQKFGAEYIELLYVEQLLGQKTAPKEIETVDPLLGS